MSNITFRQVLSCLDWDPDWMSEHFSHNSHAVVSSDETMAATCAKNNPHHTFSPGKPDPNGIQLTSCADKNGILLALDVRKILNISWLVLRRT